MEQSRCRTTIPAAHIDVPSPLSAEQQAALVRRLKERDGSSLAEALSRQVGALYQEYVPGEAQEAAEGPADAQEAPVARRTLRTDLDSTIPGMVDTAQEEPDQDDEYTQGPTMQGM